MTDTGQPANPPAPVESVTVDIYDQRYHLRGTDTEHIQLLAALVDGKMRAVAAQGATVDSLRVAVLAALNISDELLALREKYTALTGNADHVRTDVKSRADSLAELLDAVLDERKTG